MRQNIQSPQKTALLVFCQSHNVDFALQETLKWQLHGIVFRVQVTQEQNHSLPLIKMIEGNIAESETRSYNCQAQLSQTCDFFYGLFKSLFCGADTV